MAGLHPLHWKNAEQVNSNYQVRSARGVIKFSELSEFSYQMPFVGVLPTLPTAVGEYNKATLEQLIKDFIAQGESNWNTSEDTYWSGKNYGKVAELAAIARSIGMTAEADTLINWLKKELANWFTAKTDNVADEDKYFVYDHDWNTLLGIDESFASHQMLNDHHFHYGYFVRAAAEICRIDKLWCNDDQYGPMIELLIRDYAADDNDPLFPPLRHFDPANGFSWASGMVNFTRGNNNESTSEAANAYGAMVLYGLITDQKDITNRGIYLHASTTQTFWQYWNNIDRFLGKSSEYDNFPSGFKKITTSILWGDGAVFSTWFSPHNAHILGIQSLPTNPLTVHIAQYPDYLAKYIDLGLAESSNGNPSGLDDDQWRDIWWNIMAMNDSASAISDYESMPSYIPEEGESQAHTYHWLHTWKNLGHLASGTGAITADDPATMVFDNNGVKTYVAYNFSGVEKTVSFSDGATIEALPYNFAVATSTELEGDDTVPPSQVTDLELFNITQTRVDAKWHAASDNIRVVGYLVSIYKNDLLVVENSTAFTQLSFDNLDPEQQYVLKVIAYDNANNQSTEVVKSFTTASINDDLPPILQGSVFSSEISQDSVVLDWVAAQDDIEVSGYNIILSVNDVIAFEKFSANNTVIFSALDSATTYQISITAVDNNNQESSPITGVVTTQSPLANLVLFTDVLADDYVFGNYPGNSEDANDSINIVDDVIDAQFTGGGNFYLIAPTQFSMVDYAQAYLKFDLAVVDFGTTEEVIIKMDSGWPSISDLDLSAYGELIADGQMRSYVIPVNDFIESSNRFSPGDKMDINAIINPVVFEGSADGSDLHLKVDNIQFSAQQ